MRDRSLGAVVADCTDVELAAIFERIWEARGYETRVRLHGPDVHVEAMGETPEGVHRVVRIWISTATRLTSDKMRAFVRQCDHADVEPYVAAVGRGRLDDDAHRPGLVELDAPTIAVEVRETGVESFVRELAHESDERPKTNWLGDPIEGSDGDASDERETGHEKADGLTRRAALTKTGTYVVASLATSLVVARLSDTHLPSIEWEIPHPQPLSEDTGVANTTSTAVEKPADATTIPYADLRSNPDFYTGTTVTYTGRVTETRARDDVRLAIVAVEDQRERVRGDVVARWPPGRFFENEVGFRLLERERIRVWGVVAGDGSLDGEISYPRIDVTVLEKA